MSALTGTVVTLYVIVLGLIAVQMWTLTRTRGEIQRLQAQVRCLQSPTAAISSIGPLVVHAGKVTGKLSPTTVICP